MKYILVLALLALAGCAATPTSIVQVPTSARPIPNDRTATGWS